jgi:uncharacterized protein YqjF (DUF2071 family)
MPTRPWLMRQTWHDLLFAHWPIDPRELRSIVPRPFAIDRFHGDAWIGIVAFRMTNVAPRGVPAIPWLSSFPELNVRTYVWADDKPGVYFFSLDAGSALAVRAARAMFNLPYFPASMRMAREADVIRYESRRRHSHPTAEFLASYAPINSPFRAAVGTIEYFLTERYCLYHLDHSGRPYRLEIHHPPWRLHSARATFERNTMAAAGGVPLPTCAPLVHFAQRQDMVAWTPTVLLDVTNTNR